MSRPASYKWGGIFFMMKEYKKQLEIRWADLDPNFHVLHSKYYDMGAYVRMCYLTENGITPAAIQQHQLGPIIFREECVFRKEIKFGDAVSIDLNLLKAKQDATRWTMQHHIFIKGDTLAAIVTVDGAWMDLQKRKLGTPPQAFVEAFEAIPKPQNFEWM
ncbi:MAG: thioesterase family protein [Chitinophagaceae bacterium]|nr:thioesterase family protein [Chitinophagaceae bacterium]